MLTQKQRDLLLFIDKYTKNTGCSPSFEEMKDGLGLKSKSGIHRLINSLVERGFLEKLANKARALEVIKLPEGAVSNSRAESNFKSKDTATSKNYAPTSSNEEMVEVPLHGYIAAGTPIEAIRNEQETISIPAHMLGNKRCYALTVDGDSMIKAGIMNGDIVIIEECNNANNGDIVVVV